jgi:hypothetical protein
MRTPYIKMRYKKLLLYMAKVWAIEMQRQTGKK